MLPQERSRTTFIDELESRGFVARITSNADRRVYSIQVKPLGTETFQQIATIAHEHDQALTGGLDPEERKTLSALPERIAMQEGLTPGVHPGYRQASDRVEVASADSKEKDS